MGVTNTGTRTGVERRCELRIALATSGAIALVLYESGVAHEVLRFLRAWEERSTAARLGDGRLAERPRGYGAAFAKIPIRPVIDILVGASAGGINSVLLGSCIATGAEFEPFHDTWIGQADIAEMRYSQTRPLSLLCTDAVTAPIRKQLIANAQQAAGTPARSAPDVLMRLCRTHLRGHCLTSTDAIGHRIDEATHSDVVGFDTTAFLAWKNQQVDLGQITALMNAALATSAVPGAFPPILDGGRYYIDGGLLNNQPIDLAVRATVDKPAFEKTYRCVFFIDPDPTTERPGQPETAPSLLQTVGTVAGLGLKGTIWPAIDDILSTNERVRLYQRLVRLGGDVLQKLGEAEADSSKRQLEAAAKAQDAAAMWLEPEDRPEPTVLNQVRADLLLFDEDPALVQRWHSVLTRLGFNSADPAKSSLLAKKAVLASLAALASVGEVDLQRRAVRRALDELNEEIADPAKRSEDAFRQKACLYGALEQINDYLYPPDDSLEYDLPDYLRDVARPNGRFRTAAEQMLRGVEDRLTQLQVEGGDTGQAEQQILSSLMDWKSAVVAAAAGRPTKPISLSDTKTGQLYARHQERRAAEAGQDAAAVDPALQTSALPDPTPIDYARHILAGISDLGARKPIDLVRISPNDTNNLHLLPPQVSAQAGGAAAGQPAAAPAAARKLAGAGLGHFAGFLDSRWRRNDYIWGRLDACEILLRALQQYGLCEGIALSEADFQQILVEAQTDILQEEARLYHPFSGEERPDLEHVGGVPAQAASPSDNPSRQEANAHLIGYGGQTVGDVDEGRLLGDLNYLFRTGLELVEGVPGWAAKVEALPFLAVIDPLCHFLLRRLRRPQQ